MPDKKKYIDMLEEIVKAKDKYYKNDDVPVRISYQCVVDILDLLKEQEGVIPKQHVELKNYRSPWLQYSCGGCKEPLLIRYKFCPNCGFSIPFESKWEYVDAHEAYMEKLFHVAEEQNET